MSNSLVGLSLFAGSASLVYAVRALLKRGASSASSAAGAAMDIEDCAKVLCAKRGSVPVDVVAGKTYYYCTCGRSDKQPFCNGAHKGTRFAPTAWTATETKTVYFCGCKQVCPG